MTIENVNNLKHRIGMKRKIITDSYEKHKIFNCSGFHCIV